MGVVTLTLKNSGKDFMTMDFNLLIKLVLLHTHSKLLCIAKSPFIR